MNRVFGAALLLGKIAAHAARRRETKDIAQRLAAFPRTGWPVSGKVVIHWDDHQIPFIVAQTDADLAVAVGAVHAHLRLGQMEIARRTSQGRIAEMIGPIGVAADRLVRTLDMGRAVAAIEEQLPDETRSWLEGFTRGINHYLANTETLPEEFALFDLTREPWRVADILLLGRFICADVSWLVQFPLLPLHGSPEGARLWRRLTQHDAPSSVSPSTVSLTRYASLALALGGAVRAGSNAFAIAGSRTNTGAAIIGSDPHLPITLPGPWLIAGMKSPSCNVVGMMAPGIPFVSLGRNAFIAWGGTSLNAASTDLVKVPKSCLSQIHTREVEIKVRWSRPQRFRLRESPWGPIISDIPRFNGNGATIALRWVGHRSSDESTAMFGVNRARSWSEFHEALDGFAVPGINMIFASAEGQVGKLMAVHLPNRGGTTAPEFATDPGAPDGWEQFLTSKHLPSEVDPVASFVASANDRPNTIKWLVGRHFSPPDRRQRLDALLSASNDISVESAAKIQRDVHWPRGLEACGRMLEWIGLLAEPLRQRSITQLIATLRGWDGNYASESRGAAAFELLFFYLSRRMVPRRSRRTYQLGWGSRILIWQDICLVPQERRQPALYRAVREAARALRRYPTWGTLHRVHLGYPLVLLPIIGRLYRVANLPSAGGSETLLKTANALSARRHVSRFGTTARHLSDFSDPDRNYFVLIGGQDGWLGSTTFADQTSLWDSGEYINVPLQPETAAAQFSHRTEMGA